MSDLLIALQRVAEAEASYTRAKTNVSNADIQISRAEDKVSEAEKTLKDWMDEHPEHSGEEPVYKTREAAIERAIAAVHRAIATRNRAMEALVREKVDLREATVALERKLELADVGASNQTSMEVDLPDENVFSALESMDDLVQSDKVLNLEIKEVEGIPDFLFSKKIYNDEVAIGIKMPVDELLKINESTIILIGVSGCGKTRTCYDYARHHWCLYFDCTMDADIQAMISQLKALRPPIKSKASQAIFEGHSAKLINCLLAARLLVLRILREKTIIDPFEWHRKQRSGRSRRLFKIIFRQLSSYAKPVVLEIFEQLSSDFDGRVIFDESQYLLTILRGDYHSSRFGQDAISDYQFKFPRSLFSFLSRYIIVLKLKSIWCGTHMRIRNTDLIYSAASGKEDTGVRIFTQFSYLDSSAIFRLCSMWIREDIFEPQRILFDEISNFVQGRPRFFISFLHALVGSSNVREAFEWYRDQMTTKMLKVLQTNSRYMICLLKFCTASLFGNRARESIHQDLDLVSTCLVMVNYERKNWEAFMTEPMVIAAGMNFLADQHRYAMSNYFAPTFLAPVGGPSLSPQERGNQMELIIAVRFIQGWWQEPGLKELLPGRVQDMNIPKPIGILDCRFNEGPLNMFVQQLQTPSFPWVICPATNAGPDLRYNVFCCYAKTTSTPSSKTTMQISAEETKNNVKTMNPVNWYKSQEGQQVYSDCLAEVSQPGRRFVHMRFEMPDTAPSLKHNFKSGAAGTTTLFV
ncbi:hypothetical protein HDU81_010803 [Chytriomyces hyalinus]|nr:hypothetical protein HDU81_010803 [Chytriomyces hyalinus]